MAFARLQLRLARKLLVLATGIFRVCSFAYPPGPAECTFWLRENGRIQKAQEVMLSFGIIAPPKSAASMEHSQSPETGGGVSGRRGGFGLLVVQGSG